MSDISDDSEISDSFEIRWVQALLDLGDEHDQRDRLTQKIEEWEKRRGEAEQNADLESLKEIEKRLAKFNSKLSELDAKISSALRERGLEPSHYLDPYAPQGAASPGPPSEPKDQAHSAPRHQPKQAVQERFILDSIRQLGHEPTSIPKWTTGEPGVKAAVKSQCLAQPKLFSSGSFDKAWERLRAAKEIADDE